ncbi:MAG: STAS domain-containing protein [Phycisphaerales bacterium]|nr:STAS domain-containing protein [Phycisphaerales bacterium]MCB9857090.1 STAS domain-containing protein [Phycisphaerales bacterium]MCB9861783.1 STAS domain-containing protein [Phycisphaerales bacterium]
MSPTSDGNKDAPFEMRVSTHDEATVLALCGACTMSDAESLGDKIMEIALSPAALLVLELSDLEFIESTNLGKIVAGYLQLRKRHGDLRVVAPQPKIRHLLDLTRLSTLFGVFDSIPDAVGKRPH